MDLDEALKRKRDACSKTNRVEMLLHPIYYFTIPSFKN
jgi:hypothetical protein